MALQVLFQVLNLSLLMLLGFFLRKKVFDTTFFQQLNFLIVSVTLPCLAFTKLQVPFSPSLFPSFVFIFLLGSLFTLLSGALGFFLFKKESFKDRRVFTHLTMFTNSAFIGFPILSAAFGEDALIYGVIFVASFNILVWTVGVWLFAGKGGFSIKQFLSNPTLLASFLGLFCFLFSIKLPSFPLNALSTVGDMTTPLSMVVIGASLVGFPLTSFLDLKLYFLCALRLIILPLVFYLLFKWLVLPPMVFETIFIILAMPCAAVTAIQAQQYGSNQALAVKGVALSTVFCIATIPLIMLLL